MAIRIPIITDLQDKGIRDAKKAFGDFKTAVNNAEGGLGKFKAGSTAIFDAVKANAVTFGIAAGAAVVAFAKKSITAFQTVALQAGKFADATGLAVEDASRYIDAAGDIGILMPLKVRSVASTKRLVLIQTKFVTLALTLCICVMVRWTSTRLS